MHLLRIGLLAVEDGPPLNRVLIVLTVVALAVTGAEDARLEALAVLLETSRFFAGATLRVLLVSCRSPSVVHT